MINTMIEEQATYWKLRRSKENDKVIALEKKVKFLESEVNRITAQRENLKTIIENQESEIKYLEEENTKLCWIHTFISYEEK